MYSSHCSHVPEMCSLLTAPLPPALNKLDINRCSFLLLPSFFLSLSFLPVLVLFNPPPLPLLFLLATLGKYSKRIPGFFSWLLSGRVGRRLVCVYCLFLLYHRRREGGNVFFCILGRYDFSFFFFLDWKENFSFVFFVKIICL